MSGDQLFILGVIAQIVTVIGVLLTYLQGRNNQQKIAQSESKIDKLHIDVNSRLTQLLEVTGRSEHARGQVEARESEIERVATIAAVLRSEDAKR